MDIVLKTEDIRPPKTGKSVHLSSSLGERNCKTGFPLGYRTDIIPSTVLQAIPRRSALHMAHKRIEQTTWCR